MISCTHKVDVIAKAKPGSMEEAETILKSLYPDCGTCPYISCGYVTDAVVQKSNDPELYTGFTKAREQEDEQLVFGWANWSLDPEGQLPFDWHGDAKSPGELEKAAYNFVLKYRVTGEQHQGGVKGHLVESMMFTKEKMQAMGIPEGVLPVGWWVGFHIPDKEVFAKVKSGEYQMFSIEGKSRRVPIAKLTE